MESALVSVGTGVMKPLLSKLSKKLEEDYAKAKGVHRNITFIRDELSTMSATLEMLADLEDLSPQMREWRDKVRELAYDMEDCVDGFTARGDRPVGFFRKLKELKDRHKIANEIEELKTRAIDASERQRRYNFVEQTHNSSTSNSSAFSIDPRLPALYEEFDRLVGINGPMKHVIEWLTKDGEAQLKVVSIVGSGGLGKTTLANQVYQTMRSRFSYSAFVSVSRKPDMKKIVRDLAEGMGITDYKTDDDVQQLIDKLRKHLQDKRYFVVIDDVWDAEPWGYIRFALFNIRCGSRIIVTTRNSAVASSCSSDGGYVYQMEPLCFADSKRLFCKRAFGSEGLSYPHLEKVCDGILEKCGGLPLAIITLSSLLVDQHAIDEWDRVLTAIGSALANNPGVGNMTKILSLSYFDLPQHLRTCLLYLSVFPEDYEINKQHLIHRWIAEGFLLDERCHNTFEVGEHCFNDLINRSLIQPVDVKYGQAKACRVHDIILDFITCKAAEENFVTSLDTSEYVHVSDYRVRRLCVGNHNNGKATIPANMILCYVRSLTIFGCFMVTSLLAFRTLRVLDLTYCLGLQDHHIENIGKLCYLKYLRLGVSSITMLPKKIGELVYLETLDTRGSVGIRELPPSIARLQRLARLYVDRYIAFPQGIIGQMQNLEELEEFYISSCKQGNPLQEFIHLTKLRTLKVCFHLPNDLEGRSQAKILQTIVGTSIFLLNLHHLYVVGDAHLDCPLSLESWFPTTTCRLRKLHITSCHICKVPNWMSMLGSLTEIKLHIVSMRPEDVEILGAIPSLLFLELKIVHGTEGRIFIRGNKEFRNLKYFSLQIEQCGTALEFEAGSLRKLEHLELAFPVHGMECINGASDFGIQHLSTLSTDEDVILGFLGGDNNYNPMADRKNSVIKCVASLIKSSIETLPNRPTGRFKLRYDFGSCLLDDTSEAKRYNADVYVGGPRRFSLRELRVATDNFSYKNVIGRGGFGKVYKGRLADGSLVAVKRLKEETTVQFRTEVNMISMAVHRNLLRLRGFCITPTERLLVYPYMANGSVASRLRERLPHEPPLDWQTRMRIALCSARGLSYLHEHCDPKIIHRDVKAANILLDEDFEAVVGDFGLTKLMDHEDTHVTSPVRGTIGHIPLEYLSAGEISEKTDVFGYGIMLLELITGQRAFDLALLANDDDVMLLDWVKGLLKEKKLAMLIDPDLAGNYIEVDVELLLQVALLCAQRSPMDRPTMLEVVRFLECGDGLAEKWEEWQKVEVKRQEEELADPLRNLGWIVDSTGQSPSS